MSKVFEHWLDVFVVVLILVSTLSAVSYFKADNIFDTEITYINSAKLPYSVILNLDNKVKEDVDYNIEVIYKKENLVVGSGKLECDGHCETKIEFNRIFFDKYEVVIRGKYYGVWYEKVLDFEIKKNDEHKVILDPVYYFEKGSEVVINGQLVLKKPSNGFIEVFSVNNENASIKVPFECNSSCDFSIPLMKDIVLGEYKVRVYFSDDVVAKSCIVKYRPSVSEEKGPNVNLDNIRNFSRFNAINVSVGEGKEFVKVLDLYGHEKEVKVKKTGVVSLPQGYVKVLLNDSRKSGVDIKPEFKSLSYIGDIKNLSVKQAYRMPGFVDFGGGYVNDSILKNETGSYVQQSVDNSFNPAISSEEKVFSSDLKSYVDLNESINSFSDNKAVRKLVPGVYKKEKVVKYLDGSSEVFENYFAYGLISINTKKPLYHKDELVGMTIVVLDKWGFLVSGANINLVVVGPSNSSVILSTDNNQIYESSKKGVYLASMFADEIGEYKLFARVELEDMIVDVSSYFNVVNNYDFDIVRDVPVTIDPWEGPFTNKFTITPLNGYKYNYEFEEVFSSDFDVVDGDYDDIRKEEDSIYLIWRNLSGVSKISYSAQVPLVSPYLYFLGKSRIFYDEDKVFYENRSFLFAIDPAAKVCSFTSPCICGGSCAGGGEPGDGTIDTCADTDYSWEFVNDIRVINLNGTYFGTGDTVEICVDFDCDTSGAGDLVTIGYKGSSVPWNNSHVLQEWQCFDTSIVTYCTNTTLGNIPGVHNVRAKIVWEYGGQPTNTICDPTTWYGDNDDINITVLERRGAYYNLWNLTNVSLIGNGLNVTWGKNLTAFALWDKSIQSALIRHNGNGSFVNYFISNLNNNYTNYTLDTSDLSEFSSRGIVNISYIKSWDFYFNLTNQTDSRYFTIYGTPKINSSFMSPYVIYNSTNVTIGCQVADEFVGVRYPNYVVNFYHSLNGYLGSNVTNSSGFAKLTYLDSNPVGNYTITCNVSSNLTGYYMRSVGKYFKNQTLYVKQNGSDINPPVIKNIVANPSLMSIGGVVNIRVNVTDDVNLTNVYVNITSPLGVSYVYPMIKAGGDIFERNFSLTTLDGVYYYYVFAYDNSSNPAWSSDYSFEVIGIRTFIGIKSTKSFFKVGENINLTYYSKDSSFNLTSFAEKGDVNNIFYNFDSSWDSWSSGGVQNEWQRGVPSSANFNTCASGNCLCTDLNDTYNANSNQWVQSPLIDFTGRTNVKVVYWRMLRLYEAGDDATFESWDGSSWNILYQDTTVPGSEFILNAGTTTVYPSEVEGVNGARFRFSIVSDAVTQREGWVVDNFNITFNPRVDWDKDWYYINSSFGLNYDKITAIKVGVNVTSYSSLGSVSLNNNNPDLEFQIFNGTGYSNSYFCNLDSSKSYPYFCEFVIKNTPEYLDVWNSTNNRRIRFRAVDLDMNDYINWTGIKREVVSPSIIQNHGIATVTSYLLEQFKNSTGGVVQTMYFSPVSLNASESKELSSYWSFSVPGGFKLGNYSAYVALTDGALNVLQNDDDNTYINDSYDFQVISLIIDPVVPKVGMNVSDSFIANLSLDTTYYSAGGWCGYSYDGGLNITMSQVNSTFYESGLFSNISDGLHSIIFYCNDSDNYMVNSGLIFFNVTQNPKISFVPPTDLNNSYVNRSYTNVNVSIVDSSNTSAFIDFNNSLVAYWSFENVSGGVVYDSSSYGNDGTLIGNATIGGDMFKMIRGKYLQTNYSETMDVADDSSLEGMNEITVEAWVYPETGTGTFGRILEMPNRYYIAREADHWQGYVYNSTGSRKITWDSGAYVTGKWFHLAMVYNGSSLKVYTNGVLMNTLSHSGSVKTDWTSGTIGRMWNGSIDEVKVWRRALSDDEIKASYNSRINILNRNFSGLKNAGYPYYACAIDVVGNRNCTEERIVNINMTVPDMKFISPLNNEKFGITDKIFFNVSTDLVAQHVWCEFNNNGTFYFLSNYSMYNWTYNLTLYTGYYNITCYGNDSVGNSLSPIFRDFLVLPDKYVYINKRISSLNNNTYLVNLSLFNYGKWLNYTLNEFVDNNSVSYNYSVLPDSNFSIVSFMNGTIYSWNVSIPYMSGQNIYYYVNISSSLTSLLKNYVVSVD